MQGATKNYGANLFKQFFLNNYLKINFFGPKIFFSENKAQKKKKIFFMLYTKS